MNANDDRLFWNTHTLAFKDLPTLQELFADADEKLLVDLIMERVVKCECDLRAKKKLGRKQRKKIRTHLKASLDDMYRVRAKKSKKWCLFPLMLIDGETRVCGMPVAVHAECVKRSDFPLASTIVDARHEESGRVWLPTYSIIHESWKKVLGYRVWLEGCESRLERYLFLVDAFWEMTFLGFREKTHEKNLKKEIIRLQKELDDLESGKTATMSTEVLEKHLGMANYGLKDRTASLEDEFRGSAQRFMNRLNEGATLELYRRIAKLDLLLEAEDANGRS